MSVSIVNSLLSTADKGELSLFLDIIKNSGTETDDTPPSHRVRMCPRINLSLKWCSLQNSFGRWGNNF